MTQYIVVIYSSTNSFFLQFNYLYSSIGSSEIIYIIYEGNTPVGTLSVRWYPLDMTHSGQFAKGTLAPKWALFLFRLVLFLIIQHPYIPTLTFISRAQANFFGHYFFLDFRNNFYFYFTFQML